MKLTRSINVSVMLKQMKEIEESKEQDIDPKLDPYIRLANKLKSIKKSIFNIEPNEDINNLLETIIFYLNNKYSWIKSDDIKILINDVIKILENNNNYLSLVNKLKS